MGYIRGYRTKSNQQAWGRNLWDQSISSFYGGKMGWSNQTGFTRNFAGTVLYSHPFNHYNHYVYWWLKAHSWWLKRRFWWLKLMLAGGFKHFFHNIWDVILPIDELVFSRWLKPPTRYVYIYMILYDYRLYMCAKVNLSIKLTNLI